VQQHYRNLSKETSGSKDMRNGRMKSAPAHCGFSQTASCSPPSGLKRRKACG